MGKISNMLKANLIISIGMILFVLDQAPLVNGDLLYAKQLGAVLIIIGSLWSIGNKIKGNKVT